MDLRNILSWLVFVFGLGLGFGQVCNDAVSIHNSRFVVIRQNESIHAL